MIFKRVLDKLFPSNMPPRLFLVFFAIAIQLIAEGLRWGFDYDSRVAVVSVSVALWVIWFCLILLTVRPSIDNLLRPCVPRLRYFAAALILVLGLLGIGELLALHLATPRVVTVDKVSYSITRLFNYNDSTALAHQASDNLLEGENPYEHSNVIEALDDYPFSVVDITPLEQGAFEDVFPYPTGEQLNEAVNQAMFSPDEVPEEFESKVSYPAGSFLFQTPFVALGMEDLRYFYLLCAIATMLLILWKAPQGLRPIVIATFTVSLVLWNLVGTGTIHTLYVLFIMLGWIFRRQLWLSGIFMGMAISSNQIAGLFVLFYLIWLLREIGWDRAIRSLGIVAGAFAAINVPFIFSGPVPWLEGVLAPIRDPMFPRGDGIIAFSIVGILPPVKPLFISLELGVLFLAAAWYYFNCRRCPAAGLILPVLPLFFAWRSYSHYFYFASLLVFGAIVISEYSKSRNGEGLLSQLRSLLSFCTGKTGSASLIAHDTGNPGDCTGQRRA